MLAAILNEKVPLVFYISEMAEYFYEYFPWFPI